MPLPEKYELELTPVAFGETRLELFQIKNWDIFFSELAEKGEDYVKSFPFWIKIWEASLVLTHHLIRAGIKKEAEILEIGAGMGVTGLALGALGYHVTVTDYEDDALQLLEMNVKHNRLDTVLVRKLDWNHPDLTQKYDIICGSELIYNESFIEPVISLFQNCLQSDGSGYVAHDITRKSMMKFNTMISGRFDVRSALKTFRGDDISCRIVVQSLRAKRNRD